MTIDKKMQDTNRLGGRISRYARVTRTVGHFAGKMAASRVFGLDLDSDRQAADLKNALGGLKGPLMKVAQILATIPGALPESYARELSQLQANAPAMSRIFVKRRMATELGSGWQSQFSFFDYDAMSAASLGQVHRAITHDDRAIVCKLQYPDMSAAVEADLAQLTVLFSIYRRGGGAIDPGHIHTELADRLREELDYTLEARHMDLYRDILSGHPSVSVPTPIPDLSTQRLLTMTRLDGVPILSLKEADQDTRNQLAQHLFHAWYDPLFSCGVIHGDPHPGNYTAGPDGQINLLDFGCIRTFQPTFIAGVIDLYRATLTNDTDLAVHAYETWGFDNLTRDVVDTLNMWARFLFDAWMDDRVRPLQTGEKTAGVYGRETAEKVFLRLKELGGITPPREFVFMDRAALGMGSVFMHLDARLNWHRLMEDIMDRCDLATMPDHQTRLLQKHGVPLPC